MHARAVDVFTAGLYKELNRSPLKNRNCESAARHRHSSFVILMSPAPPLPTTKTVKAQQDSSKNLYLVHHVGQVQGPFELDFVEAMVMSGVYAPTVMIQKAGTSSLVAFSQVIRSKSGPINLEAASAVQRGRGSAVHGPATRVPKSSHQFIPETGKTASKSMSIEAKFAWGTSIVVGLFFYWLFCEESSRSSSSSKQTTAALLTDNSWSQSQPQQTVPRQAKPVISQPVDTHPTPINTLPDPLTYTPPSSPITSGFSTTSYQKSPSIAIPSTASAELTQVYRDASGQMFRIPNFAYYGLLSKKTALTSEKRNLDQLESEMSALGDEIDRSRRYLDRTSQYSIDSFNLKVNRANEMSNRLQDATDAYNRRVDDFNAELARVGTPIY